MHKIEITWGALNTIPYDLRVLEARVYLFYLLLFLWILAIYFLLCFEHTLYIPFDRYLPPVLSGRDLRRSVARTIGFSGHFCASAYRHLFSGIIVWRAFWRRWRWGSKEGLIHFRSHSCGVGLCRGSRWGGLACEGCFGCGTGIEIAFTSGGSGRVVVCQARDCGAVRWRWTSGCGRVEVWLDGKLYGVCDRR